MWPQLLMYGIPAVLGGIEGYRRSGGNLGAAALGSGLGAAVPGGLRLAGTALAGTELGASLLGGSQAALRSGAGNIASAASGLGKEGLAGLTRSAAATGATGLRSAAQGLTPAAIGAGAATLGGLVAPSIAGNVASNVAGPVSSAVGAAGAMGVPGLGAQQAPGTYPYPQYAVPSGMGQYGPTPQFNPWNVVDPTGQFAAVRFAEGKEQDVQIEGMKKLEAALAPITEGRSKAEFLRQMAAAGIRANILTNQQNMLGGLATARQMGLTGAQQVGQALTQQYQYS